MFQLHDMPVPIEMFIVREIGEETIIMAEDGNDIHVLDEIGSFIWQSIDGINSIQTILEKILNEYDVSKDIAQKDLFNFLEDLKNKKIIKIEADNS